MSISQWNIHSTPLLILNVLTLLSLLQSPSPKSLPNLKANPVKIKKEYHIDIDRFCRHSHYKREEHKNIKEQWYQSKTETQQGKYQMPAQHLEHSIAECGPLREKEPHLYGLSGCSPRGHSLRLVLHVAYSFSQHTFHIPGISNILESPLPLQLHTSPWQGLQPTNAIDSQAFLQKSQ